LVGDFDNKNYLVNESYTADINQIFEFIFNGKKLPYDLVKKYLFVVEACEYKRHFLNLDLDYACISSLELDHTDYYKDWSDYLSAFTQLIRNVRKNVFIAESLSNISEIQNEKNIYVKSESFYLKNLR
jgi:UDP-N-acetylmuramate-alanine ligase